MAEFKWPPVATGGGGGAGTVTGPGTSTINGIARYSDTTGTVIKDSSVTVDDTGGVALNYETLSPTAGDPAYAEGRLFYDNVAKTLAYYNDSANVKLNVGQETFVRATNNTGSTIPNGTVVYISGATGLLPTIAPAIASASVSTKVTGITTEAIANGANGYVTSFGVVHTLDTSAFVVGNRLYLSSTVAGGLTSTAPAGPNYVAPVGYVLVVSATIGQILVAPNLSAQFGMGTANQIRGVNAAGTAEENKDLLGTAGDIVVTNSAGGITLSLGASTGTGSIVRSTSPVITTPTGIVKGDVGLGNVDNTSDATKNAAAVTLTNKTLTDPIFTGDGSAPTYAEGKMWYDTVDKTIRYYNNSSNFSPSIDQSSVVRVLNNTGSTLTKGMVVSYTGASGGVPTIAKSNGGNLTLSERMCGLLAEDILTGNIGYAVTSGLVENIDTSAFTAGAQVYASSGVLGAMVTAQPAFVAKVGTIIVSSATVGSVFVKMESTTNIPIGANNAFYVSNGTSPSWRAPTGSPITLTQTASTVRFTLDSVYRPNAVTNGDSEQTTTSAVAYNNASGATPTTGTGGTATGLTVSVISSGQLAGTYSTQLVKDAANRQGNGIAFPFTIPNVMKSKMLNIQFDFSVPSGTYVDGDMVLYVYDITGTALITPTITSIPNQTGRFAARFQATANTSYRLIMHMASVSAVTYTVLFDMVSVDDTLPVSGKDALYEGGIVTKTVSAATGLQAGVSYLSNTTSSAFTVTLPKGYVGAQLRIQDSKGTWATNNLTIAPFTGDAIGQLATNATLVGNISNGWVDLAWDGSVWSIVSMASTSSSGSLYPIAIATSTTAVTNSMYETDVTSGSVTITLPGGTTAAVVGALDSKGIVSATNKIIFAPATGQSIDSYATNDTASLQYPNSQAVLYRAAGSTVWKGQYQAATLFAGGTLPGAPSTASIAASYVGEVIQTAFTSTSTPANTITACGSVVLTAGVWDIVAQGTVSGTGGTNLVLSMSTSSGSFTGAVSGTTLLTSAVSSAGVGGATMAPFRIVVTTSTTYVVNFRTDSSSATVSGFIRGERK